MSRSQPESVYSIIIPAHDTDFILGVDKFEDLTINESPEHAGFHYFINSSKTFVKRFVLKRTKMTEKICEVTLIKLGDGKFEPRFEFKIINLTKKAIETLQDPVIEAEDRLVKARVNLDDCHKEFSELLAFLNGCSNIELPKSKYAIVTADEKLRLDKVIGGANKDDVLLAVSKEFAHDISEQDIILITKRKSALDRFGQLLRDPAYFAKYQQHLKDRGFSSRREDVWQHFFEHNKWIFGYGLQLVACEGLDDRKLETIVVGSDLFDGAGKRIDGFLKTKGSISSSLFTEIKLHDAPLLEKYERSAVYAPAKELRGAVAQMQKTIHKVSLKINQNLVGMKTVEGEPSGEVIGFVRPRGLVLIGSLSEFEGEHGLNDEMFASFELYRQQISGLEILTYDELYERTRFIVEDA